MNLNINFATLNGSIRIHFIIASCPRRSTDPIICFETSRDYFKHSWKSLFILKGRRYGTHLLPIVIYSNVYGIGVVENVVPNIIYSKFFSPLFNEYSLITWPKIA